MKKLFSVILTLSMALSLLPAAVAQAADDYDVVFPDAALNDYMVLNFDKNMDGKIQKSEITFKASDNSWITLNIPSEVQSLAGLEHLSAGSGVSVSFRGAENWDYLTDYDVAPIFESAKGSIGSYYDMRLWYNNDSVDRAFSNVYPADDGLSAYISLTIDCDSAGTSLNLSNLEGYAVKFLEVYGYIGKGYSGKYLDNLVVCYAQGPGVQELLASAPNLVDVRVRMSDVNFIHNTSNLNSLQITGRVSGYDMDSNKVLAEFVQTHNLPCLYDLSLRNTDVYDISPLARISALTYLDMRYYEAENHSYWDGQIADVNGKTPGDYVLAQMSALKLDVDLSLEYYQVTDLTPLEDYLSLPSKFSRKNISLSHNWISLAYKNNKAIYDKYMATRGAGNKQIWLYVNDQLNNYTSMPYEFIIDADGNKLLIESSVDKSSYIKGENITAALKITNAGAVSADCDLYVNIEDDEWDNIQIKNGDRVQHVSNLAPGQSVVKTISFSASSKFSSSYIDLGFMCLSGDKIGIGRIASLPSREYVYLKTGDYAFRDEPMHFSMNCAPDMKSVRIEAEDGTVLATPTYSGGTYAAGDIVIPQKYWPAEGQTPNKIKIKAVVTDADGNSYSSEWRTVNVVNYSLNDKLGLVDCHYTTRGSGRVLYTPLTSGIMYYGDRIIVRAKFSVDPSEIQSVRAVINGRGYDMTLGTGGKYEGYYGVVSDAINSDSYYITISVTTKSGEVLEQFIGCGKILIDPSGIITDPNGEPIEGVKVTLQKKQEDGTWANWDAENYMQSNPVYTNEKGYYGWDVVEGTYRIIAEKEGYKTKTVERYYSRDAGEETEITVLPPRFDVDFTLEFADPANPPKRPMTDDSAKTAVQNALAGMQLDASATDADVINELSSVVTENMYVSFKKGTYVKTASTADKSGSINGTLILENLWTAEQQEIPANVILKTTNGEVTEPIPTPTPTTPSAPVSNIKYTVADGKTIFHIPLKPGKVLSHRLDAIVYDTEGGEHKGSATAQVGEEEKTVDVEVDYAVKENDRVKFLDTPIKEN